MANTSHLLLPLLITNQAQKEIIVNEALIMLDAILNTGVEKINLNEPPQLAENGKLFIVGNDPKQAWKGKEKNIVYYQDGWRFIKPNEGMHFWVNDENQFYVYDGQEWVSLTDNLIKLLKGKL